MLFRSSEDGRFYSVAQSDVQQITTSGQPLMPQDYGTRLDNKQIDDLVSYLLKNASNGKQAASNGSDEE